MKYLILFFFSFFFFNSYSQQIGMQLNDNFKGKNLTLYYLKEQEKMNYYGGIIIHINEEIKTDLRLHYLYKKKFKAQSPKEYLGLELGIMRKLKQFNEFNALFLDANTQITYLSLYNYVFLNSEDIEGSGGKYDGLLQDDQYVFSLLELPPMLEVENNIGLTLKTKLTEHISFSLSAGTGFIYIRNRSPYVATGAFDWFTYRLSFAISYSLK